MCRPASAHFCIIPSPKQHCRPISSTSTLSYYKCPASMSSSQRGKRACLTAIQHITHLYQTGILTMNSSNSRVAALLWMRERIFKSERSDSTWISLQKSRRTLLVLLNVFLSRSTLMAYSTKHSSCLQKRWLSVSFSHYGSLYYVGDVQSPAGNHYIKDGKAVKYSEFAIGPATGRDWLDAGRSILNIKRGPCRSEFVSSSCSCWQYKFITE